MFRSISKSLITVLLLALSLAIYAPKTHAISLEELCQPDRGLFERIRDALEDISIRRTIVNAGTTLVVDVPFLIATGGSPANVFRCMDYIQENSTLFSCELPEDCQMRDGDEAFCAGLLNMFTDDVDQTAKLPGGYVQSGGSLAYFSGQLTEFNKQPLPLNLAYYVERQVEDVPFVGAAYAQITPSTAANYRGPLLGITFELWRIVRDAAYGFIALVMIVTGVMIMTRKKISAQAMVTVQYAIPRIVIALFLITFSYAIGATFASIGYALRGSAVEIVHQLAGTSTAEVSGFGILAVASTFIILAATGGPGVAIMILSALGFLASLLIYIAIQIKILMIYLKIIVKTIGAPFTFAIGAIPGNESKTTEWFKEIGVLVLAMLGMRALIAFTNLVVAMIIGDAITNACDVQFEFTGSDLPVVAELGFALILMPFLIPFTFAYGYYQAWQLPKKLETSLLGKKDFKK